MLTRRISSWSPQTIADCSDSRPYSLAHGACCTDRQGPCASEPAKPPSLSCRSSTTLPRSCSQRPPSRCQILCPRPTFGATAGILSRMSGHWLRRCLRLAL